MTFYRFIVPLSREQKLKKGKLYYSHDGFYELKACSHRYVNFVSLGKLRSLFSQIGFIELFKDEVMGYVMLRIIFKAN